MDIMKRSNSNGGKLIHASTKRWTSVSNLPPKYPLVMPVTLEKSVPNATDPIAMTMESRAPWMRRLRRSRPR